MATQPHYCCAILTDSRGRFVLERRPLTEPDAPGKLVCFGGGRDEGEEAEACVRRELMEELGFAAAELEHVFVLHTPLGDAWFYKGAGPEEGRARAREAGYEAVWVERVFLMSDEVGDWHRVVFAALARGEREAAVAL